jgi:hypothetical protein
MDVSLCPHFRSRIHKIQGHIIICTCIYGQPVLVQHSRWTKFILLYTGRLLYCVCLTHVLQVILYMNTYTKHE